MNINLWLKSLWQSQYVRGGAVFTAISFMVSLLNYVFNFLVARFFPLTAYGEYMTALAYVAVLTAPLGVFNILVVKKIRPVATTQRANFTAILEKKLIRLVVDKIWLIGLVVFGLIGGLLYQSNLNWWSALWIVVMISISLMSTFYSAALQAYKYFWQAGSINILATVIKILLAIFLIKFALSVTNLYLIIFIAVVLTTVWSRMVVIKRPAQKTKMIANYNFDLKKLFTGEHWLVLLSTLGIVSMLSVDVMIVKSFFPSMEVGLYAGLSLLGKIILFVTAPLAMVAFSFFTGRESQKSGVRILLLNTAFILAAGLAMLVLYLTIPDLIILAVLGAKFLQLSPLIYKALIFGLLYSLNSSYAQYALSKNHPVCLVPLALVIVQTGLLWLFHQDFNQIMNINIAISTTVLVTLFFWFIRQDDTWQFVRKFTLHKKTNMTII